MLKSPAQRFRLQMLRNFLYQTFKRQGHSEQESKERAIRIEKTAQKTSGLLNQHNPVEALMNHIVSKDQRQNGSSDKELLKKRLINNIDSQLLNELRKRVIQTKPYYAAIQFLGRPNPNKTISQSSENNKKIFQYLTKIISVVISKRALSSNELDQYFSRWIMYLPKIEMAKKFTHQQIERQKQRKLQQQQQQQLQPQLQKQQLQQQQQPQTQLQQKQQLQLQQQQQNLSQNQNSQIGVKAPQRNLHLSNTTVMAPQGTKGKDLNQTTNSKMNMNLPNQKGLVNQGIANQKSVNATNKNEGQTNTTTQKKELQQQQPLTRPSIEQQKKKIKSFLRTVSETEVKNKETLREVGLFASQIVSVNQRESHLPSSFKLNKKTNHNKKSNFFHNEEFLLKRRRISKKGSLKFYQIDSFPINTEKFF
ncbi:transcription factor spt20 [Anaeramoeba flamelloides]|uniref:Transcription factor spt20 n=1 Tax=Anaeramoeba flamelloides TaxID=1746091 RepID=A0AAV7Y1R1_9EUKA|nr:transcription factor spt20 [Anaeramoeba flamelloides]